MSSLYTLNKAPSAELGRRRRRFVATRDVPLYLLIAPALMLLIVFHYLPMYGILISFKDYSPFKGILGSDWVGFQYFEAFLRDKYFWKVMRNTLRINILSLLFGFPAPIILALLLNEVKAIRFKKVVQTISYLPYFISWVVTAAIVNTVFSPESGVVNIVLGRLFGMKPIYFMTETKFFVPIVVLAGIWKGVGLGSVYYLAALSSIDTQLYEAATLDGAGRLRQTWYVTLPGLRTIITVLLVLNLGSMVTIGFENIFLLYNPLVYEVGDVISTYTFRLGLMDLEYSLTTAIGLAQSVVNFILVVSANSLARKVGGWAMW